MVPYAAIYLAILKTFGEPRARPYEKSPLLRRSVLRWNKIFIDTLAPLFIWRGTSWPVWRMRHQQLMLTREIGLRPCIVINLAMTVCTSGPHAKP